MCPGTLAVAIIDDQVCTSAPCWGLCYTKDKEEEEEEEEEDERPRREKKSKRVDDLNRMNLALLE
jgi:hypothetical protein